MKKYKKLLVSASCIGFCTVAIGQMEGTVVGVTPINGDEKIYMVEDVNSGVIYKSAPTNQWLTVGDMAEYKFISNGLERSVVNSATGIGASAKLERNHFDYATKAISGEKIEIAIEKIERAN